MTDSPAPTPPPTPSLADLAALLRAATPAPWEVQDGCSWRRIGHVADGDVLSPTNAYDGHPDLTGRNRDADLALIVALRNEAPALLRRVAELEAEVARLTPKPDSPPEPRPTPHLILCPDDAEDCGHCGSKAGKDCRDMCRPMCGRWPTWWGGR